jgi:hypothetical protein
MLRAPPFPAGSRIMSANGRNSRTGTSRRRTAGQKPGDLFWLPRLAVQSFPLIIPGTPHTTMPSRRKPSSSRCCRGSEDLLLTSHRRASVYFRMAKQFFCPIESFILYFSSTRSRCPGDDSTWRHVINCAVPVRPDTVARNVCGPASHQQLSFVQFLRFHRYYCIHSPLGPRSTSTPTRFPHSVHDPS